MRCSCFGRAFFLALLLLVLVLSAMRGVAGSWDATPVGAIDWRSLGADVERGARAVAGAAWGGVAWAAGATWAGLHALPWLEAGEAVFRFGGDLVAGFFALLRDLVSAVRALAAGLASGIAETATVAWAWLIDRARSLAYGPTGEPLDRGRLALFAAGWVVVLGLVAWLLLRLIAGWLRALRARIAGRGCESSRPRSHARA